MSFFQADESPPAWGEPVATSSDPVGDAIKKEKIIKEITASQEALVSMLSRIKAVQSEVDKLSSGNETLQMYIDNLTKQMAQRR